MLNDEIKNRQKKLESIELTCRICNMSYETKIIIKKQTIKNYNVQFLINQIYKV
jgi:transcription elongation factor Elf1